jgi:hypothetical protein
MKIIFTDVNDGSKIMEFDANLGVIPRVGDSVDTEECSYEVHRVTWKYFPTKPCPLSKTQVIVECK